MPMTCAVLKCNSRSGMNDGVLFYKIPKTSVLPSQREISERRQKAWVKAINRQDLTEKHCGWSRVCSKHFINGRPARNNNDEQNEDWVPTLLMGYTKEVISQEPKMPTGRERIKCAELYVVPDQDYFKYEYECTGCVRIFITHSECLQHIKDCPKLQLNVHDWSNWIGNTEEDDDIEWLEIEDVGIDHHPSTISISYNEVEEVVAQFEFAEVPEATTQRRRNQMLVDPVIEIKPESNVITKLTTSEERSEKSDWERYEEATTKEKKENLSLNKLEDIHSVEYLFTRILLAKLKHNSDEKKYIVCDVCGYRTNARGAMLQHMFRKHGSKRIEQPDLNGLFRTHLPKGYRHLCNICGKTFSDSSKLRLHNHTIHYEGTRFPCKRCLCIFDTADEAKAHRLEIHLNRIYACDRCPYQSKFSINLTQHIRTHTGERPYSCQICINKKFTTKSELNSHMDGAHWRGVLRKCNLCPSEFPTTSRLTSHIRLIHDRLYSFKCSVCSKGLPNNFALKKHMYSHTSEKPFPCTLCDRKFVEANTLQDHMNRHTDTRPYNCRHCERTFYGRGSRNFHERSVHKISAGETTNLLKIEARKANAMQLTDYTQ